MAGAYIKLDTSETGGLSAYLQHNKLLFGTDRIYGAIHYEGED